MYVKIMISLKRLKKVFLHLNWTFYVDYLYLTTKYVCGFVWSPVCFQVNSDAYLSKIGINRDIFEDFTAAATSLMTVGLNLKTFVGNGNLP